MASGGFLVVLCVGPLDSPLLLDAAVSSVVWLTVLRAVVFHSLRALAPSLFVGIESITPFLLWLSVRVACCTPARWLLRIGCVVGSNFLKNFTLVDSVLLAHSEGSNIEARALLNAPLFR